MSRELTRGQRAFQEIVERVDPRTRYRIEKAASEERKRKRGEANAVDIAIEEAREQMDGEALARKRQGRPPKKPKDIRVESRKDKALREEQYGIRYA